MFSKSLLSVILASLVVSPGLAAPASPSAIALVKQQFINALITPTVVPIFNPSALLNASFPSVGPIVTGQAISKDGAGTEPTITIIGTDADFSSSGPLNSTIKYTLLMIDGNYAGSSNPQGLNTHYLQNDLTFQQANADVLSLTGTTTPVIAYAGPGPAAGSGPHRYILLMFAQPSNFAAPATPAAGSSVTMIDFQAYLKSANLGNPIAGNYFTVEVGTSTVQVSPTSSVDPATLSVSAAATGAAASASASSTAKNAASQVGVHGSSFAIFAAVFAAIAFM